MFMELSQLVNFYNHMRGKLFKYFGPGGHDVLTLLKPFMDDGFNSLWAINQYVKNFYDKFLEFHPGLINYKI